jgi:peptidoglycan hydrolase-like protein with peptidoglycan-binding domain
MPAGHYFGLITGPAKSHGGIDARERAAVTLIQQRLQVLGFAPKTPGWVDGKFEPETKVAVAAWQRARVPGTTRYGEVWSDDWRKLFA